MSPEGKKRQQSRILIYLAAGSTLQGMGSWVSGNLQVLNMPFQEICIWASVIAFVAFFISWGLVEVKFDRKDKPAKSEETPKEKEEKAKEAKKSSIATLLLVGFLFYASLQLILPYAGNLFLDFTAPGRVDLLGLTMFYSSLFSFVAILLVTLLTNHVSLHARERLFRILIFLFAFIAAGMVITWYFFIANKLVVIIIFMIPVLSPVNAMLQVMVFARVPKERMGGALSKLNSTIFLANFLGAFVAGYVLTQLTIGTDLLFAFLPAGLAMVATVLLTYFILPPGKREYRFLTTGE